MKKQVIDWQGEIVVIKYGNGAEFRGDCSELPEAIYTNTAAAKHGITQKLGDVKSGGTASEKYAEVQLVWQSLKAGDWNRRGTGEGVEGLMPDVFQVLAATQPNPEKAAAEWLAKYEKLGDEAKEELRNKPHMKAAINKVKAERRLAAQAEGEEEFNPFA